MFFNAAYNVEQLEGQNMGVAVLVDVMIGEGPRVVPVQFALVRNAPRANLFAASCNGVPA